jgi:hypothetical protein
MAAVTPATTRIPPVSNGIITDIKTTILDQSLVPVVTEMMRIFPDGLVITSGIYALLTLSFPFAIFFMSMLEATALFHAIRQATSYLGISPTTPSRTSFTYICRTGFSEPTTLLSLSMFDSTSIKNPYPSSSIYMLSVAAAYVFTTVNSQSKELQALGPAYSARFYTSLIFLTSLLFLFVCFRIACGCDSVAVVMMTLPLGLLLGMILVQQNMNLFGKGSINLMGIPLLESKSASGKPLYVCPI